MKGGNASFRYSINTILYLIIVMIWFDIFTDIFSSNHIHYHKSIMEVVPSNGESEHATTLTKCNQQFTTQTKGLKDKKFIWEVYKCPKSCDKSITDQQYDKAVNEFIDCAKKCWSQNHQNYYQIHTKDGIIFKFDNHTFQCFHMKINQKNHTVVRIGKKNSFKQNVIAELIETVCKLIGHQSANRIKNILHAQHLPLQWIIPIILIILIICLYVGYGPGVIDNVLSFRNQNNQANRANAAQVNRNHTQKIEYGWRLIEYLHQYQKEKFAIEASKKNKQRKNVKEIKDMLLMMNKQQHTAVKLISVNKGVGIQTSINAWIQQKWNQGRDIIHFNLQHQINCLERLSLDNNPINNLECILNAIIFEKDRNAITIFFTILTMTANYFFKHLLSLLDFNPIFAFTCLIIFWTISALTNYFKNQSLPELGMIQIYQIIIYLRILFLLFMSYFYEGIAQFIRNHSRFLKNKSKTVIIIDNFEKMQSQHHYNQKLNSLLIKCQQIQEMKKYQVILICRNANFTRQLIQMQVKSNYLKFDKSNVYRLSFSSVKQIIKNRHDDSKQKQMFQRSKQQAFLLSYFYDNTETIFSSMRRLRIDPKYSDKDYYYLSVNAPNELQKKELRKKICIQINIILQNARFRLKHALDPQNFANYVLAKLPPGANQNHQKFKDRQKNKFQYHLNLLQKVLGLGILDLKYDNQKGGAENANKRIEHLNQIKNGVFRGLAGAVEPQQFGRFKQEHIRHVQDPCIQSFLYKWYHRSIQNLSQNEFWSLFSENNDRETVSNIVDYLNDQGIFYFYNFNSLVNALAYFMHLHNLTEIRLNQP